MDSCQHPRRTGAALVRALRKRIDMGGASLAALAARALQYLLLIVNPGANTARRRRGDIGWGGGVGGGSTAVTSASASASASVSTRGARSSRLAARNARESRLASMVRSMKGRGNRRWEDDTSGDDESESDAREGVAERRTPSRGGGRGGGDVVSGGAATRSHERGGAAAVAAGVSAEAGTEVVAAAPAGPRAGRAGRAVVARDDLSSMTEGRSGLSVGGTESIERASEAPTDLNGPTDPRESVTDSSERSPMAGPAVSDVASESATVSTLSSGGAIGSDGTGLPSPHAGKMRRAGRTQRASRAAGLAAEGEEKSLIMDHGGSSVVSGGGGTDGGSDLNGNAAMSSGSGVGATNVEGGDEVESGGFDDRSSASGSESGSASDSGSELDSDGDGGGGGDGPAQLQPRRTRARAPRAGKT